MITKEFLYQEYIINKKSIRQISSELKISRLNLSKLIKQFNIKISKGRGGFKNKSLILPKRNLIGRRFGKLLVQKYDTGGYICLCDCGNLVQYTSRRLTHDLVKSCGCQWHTLGKNNPLWKGFGNLSSSQFSHIKSDAKRRNLEFNITIEDAWNLLVKQNYLCSITKIKICCLDGSASLDRIDSSKGYTINNIQWVHRKINEMKWDYDQKDFIYWCKLVAQNN